MAEQKYIVAIDTSGSTSGFKRYYEAAEKICENHKVTEFIAWNSTSEIKDVFVLKSDRGDGGTMPQTIVHKVRDMYKTNLEDLKKIGLVILSDGEIGGRDINETKKLLNEEPSITFAEIKLYYFGRVQSMNTGLNEIFKDTPTEIFINNLDQSVLNTKIVYTKEDIEAILTKPKEEVITMINNCIIAHNHEYLLQIKRVLQNSYTETVDLTKFVEEKDILGCIEFFKQIDANPNKKQCQNLINIVDKGLEEKKNLALSRLATHSTIKQKKVKNAGKPKVKDEEMFHECEITYIPCNAIGIAVKKIANLITKYEKSKIIALETNPFKLLADNAEMKAIRMEIADAFEYNKISAYITDKLNKHSSPFTRSDLFGWFYFADNTSEDPDHIKTILNNNMYVVGNIMNGEPKMKGNWHVWHLLILYVLATEHKKYSTENEFIFEQIKYLSTQYVNYLSLTTYYEPSAKDKLFHCFWYIFHVCPEYKFAGNSNVLRTYGKEFIAFCKKTFDFDDSENLMRVEMWKLWETVTKKYRYQDALRLLKSRFQNYIHVDGQYYLLNGKSPDGNPSAINPLIPDDMILQMIKLLRKNSSSNMFYGSIYNKPESYRVIENIVTKRSNIEIRICESTFRPTVLDYNTGKLWKEVVEIIDCRKEYSYYNLYVKYVIEKKKYPENSEELRKFIFKRFKGVIQFSNIKELVDVVFDSFKPITKTDIKEFTKMQSSEQRRQIEEKCSCAAHKRG